MKKSKFTHSQIMDALKRVESGLAVLEICRELGISTATFYNWRGKYGGMDVSLTHDVIALSDRVGRAPGVQIGVCCGNPA